ncbi:MULTISPECIES: hypothetical protein [Roseivirga]|uniref:Uncharacterized protein n=1 Tax=Roseivirga spongicola TaxID=333140 RepID=A0A150X5U6_9BACT|nr:MULTISPECIES: hypothetical protein [Roseivirga]KYG74115.1 hypothetical protein AWW68_15790 [Roseivirga spongicola]MBO6660430.1 hypothetical protein [Roseivirga sp.]MBO6759826.1 hypothetical protein [Roseivirga sp.]MBO6906833.1 hypothetical protein [Roseivirga sp.]WPZ09231.1 hypothetical protein T7867_13290 [Roseivirga spongicola]|tara:strand:- start:94 stop:348 length:255 start_codon:yes stop_codon:yes gene_type:complete
MEEPTQNIVEGIIKIAKAIDHGKLKRLLERLTEYKKSTELNNTDRFDELILEISKHLPDDYARKLKSIEFYSETEDFSNDDLPF